MMNVKTITDVRGSLTVLEPMPFPVKRIYYLHHVDPTATRGGHAHRALRRLMICVSGAVSITIRDAKTYRDMRLSNPAMVLEVAPMEWLELSDFTSDAVILVIASEEHDEADCIRDFAEFKRLAR